MSGDGSCGPSYSASAAVVGATGRTMTALFDMAQTNVGLLTIGAIVLAAIVAVVVTRRMVSPVTWLPMARLVYSETTVRNTKGKPIAAKLDQVYKIPLSSKLMVLENKTRAHPTWTIGDVLQLSAQAYVLRKMGHRVSDTGVLRIVYGRQKRVHIEPVRLYDDATIEANYDHYMALLAGKVKPRPASRRSRCRYCQYRRECPTPQV